MREREKEGALSKLLGRVLRRMLHASISGTIALKGFRCPSLSARGAILVSTSNASRRHSCTPLSSRINDPRSVFSTRTATISGRGQLHNTSEYKSFAPVTVPTLYTRGNVEVTPAILSWINLAQDKFRSNCSLDEKRKRFTFPRRKLLVPRYDCLLTVLPFYCRF